MRLVLPLSTLDATRPRVMVVCARLFVIVGLLLLPISVVPLTMNFKANAWACFTLMLAPFLIGTANRMWAGYDEFFLLGALAALSLAPVGIGIVMIVLSVKGYRASRAWWPDEEAVWGEDAHIPVKEGGMGAGRTAKAAAPPVAAVEPTEPATAD